MLLIKFFPLLYVLTKPPPQQKQNRIPPSPQALHIK